MAITYRGYTIRKSGKDLWKILTTAEQRPFFERCISVDACKVAIDCREEGGRVMTAEEHAITYPKRKAPAADEAPTLTPYEYGKAAFERGIRCAPAMDAEFLKTISPVIGSNSAAYDEWLRGWTDANLAAPVEQPAETITFTASEQAELDDMVARIQAGEIDRNLFVATTEHLTELWCAGPSLDRRRDLAARRIVEERTASQPVAPAPHLTTCPRCGSPAQHETAPNGEGYVSCGHCAAIVFDRTADDEPASEYAALAYTTPPPDATMDKIVELAYAMRHTPLPGAERYIHGGEYAREREAATRPAAPAQPAYTIAEQLQALRKEAHAAERQGLTEVVALLKERACALAGDYLAVDQMCDKGHRLDAHGHCPACLEQADLLTRARGSVAVNLEMRKVEAAIFDLPF